MGAGVATGPHCAEHRYAPILCRTGSLSLRLRCFPTGSVSSADATVRVRSPALPGVTVRSGSRLRISAPLPAPLPTGSSFAMPGGRPNFVPYRRV